MSAAADAASEDRVLYRGYRFPPEIIAHAVWLYFRFHLSFRDVQDLLAERGIIVGHESIRQWCTKFGATYAAGLRRRRAQPGDKMAPRRGPAEDLRPTTRAMAGGRSERRCAGHPGTVAARSARRRMLPSAGGREHRCYAPTLAMREFLAGLTLGSAL